jgi:hypothetical protein
MCLIECSGGRRRSRRGVWEKLLLSITNYLRIWRKECISKLIRTNFKNIHHKFAVWHRARCLVNKVKAEAKFWEKLLQWNNSLVSHFTASVSILWADSYFLKSLRLFHIVLVSRVSRRPVLNTGNVNMSSYGKTETETDSLYCHVVRNTITDSRFLDNGNKDSADPLKTYHM